MFLRELTLFYGSYVSNKVAELNLNTLFKQKTRNGIVFGKWISTVLVFCDGNFVKSKDSFNHELKVKEYNFLRVENGIVIEKYSVSNEFDFETIVDEKLKQLIIDSGFDHSERIFKYY